jgi:hypothetical protein
MYGFHRSSGPELLDSTGMGFTVPVVQGYLFSLHLNTAAVGFSDTLVEI